MYILDKEDPDWYKAQLKVPANLDGPVGLIPANYIENAKPIGAVKAIYDYSAQSEEELTLKEDEVYTLYEKDDPDWFIVEKANGDIGLAPSNYVEETKETPQTKKVNSAPNSTQTKAAPEPATAPAATTPTPTAVTQEPVCEPKWAIALYTFSPESAEETHLDDLEQVLVTDHVSSAEWWTIEHKDGTSGIVPASYVKFQDEYEADLRREDEEEERRKVAEKEKQELAAREQKRREEYEARDKERQKELAERNRQREQEEKEKARQLEAERRRKMQEEAKQREVEAKRQATLAASAMASPQMGGGSPRRSQIPAPPPPIKSTPDPSPSVSNTPVHNDPNKPDPARVRLWTDRTGAFKVDAQFIACNNGKIRLHKTNGVKIDVPVQKMCIEDLRYIEHETGMKLVDDKSDDIPLGQLNQHASSSSSRFSWADYFKRANLPQSACVQYAKSFEKEGLGEKDVDRLTHRKMKSLGMTERHVQRIQRFIETSKAEPPSDDESARPKLKGKKSVTFGAVSYIEDNGGNDMDDDDGMDNVQWQIEQDERLARELQEQEESYSGNHVGLQRRGTGRPTPAQSAPRGVNASVLTPQKFNPEPLKPTPVMTPPPPPPLPQQQQQAPLQPSPAAARNIIPTPPKPENNFEDDAWAPRVGSSPSVQPATTTTTSPAWNQQQRTGISSTPPQMPPRQRPTPPVAQQSLVDPQLLAKWGGSPALAAANHNRPVPPPPTNTTPTLNSMVGQQQQQQPAFYQQQQAQLPTAGNSSFTNLQQQQQQPTGSFASLPQQGSFTNFQPSGSFTSLPQQNTGFTPLQQNASFSSLPVQAQQQPMYNTPQSLQPQQQQQQQSFMGASPSLVPLQTVLPPALTPQQAPVQPQMTGRSWAAATPDNPFGGASAPAQQNPAFQQQQQFVGQQNTGYVQQQGYVPLQYNNTIDQNDKYAVFKTVNTSAPSVFNTNPRY